jgi:peptidyl-Lys metalloendopeptidase
MLLLFATTAIAKGSIEVSINTDKNSFSENENVIVNVTISNTGKQAVRLLKWYTPVNGLEEPLFRVAVDGKEVDFVGPHYKRPTPTTKDFIILNSGESISNSANLSEVYDFSQSGNYTISFDASNLPVSGNNRGGLETLSGMKSGGLNLSVDGRPVKMPESVFPNAVSGNTTFSKCTTTQQGTAATARNNASTYAANALSYLNSGTVGSRYTTWFGAYTSGRYSTVTSHFLNISSAMDTSTVNIDCGCKKTYYAYVYPNQPYNIYVCKAFWSAPMTGTDSKAGTLIHEMSHFTVVAGTDDWVYGQTGAKSLAISNPTNAVDNADSHEYFAENTPFQN